MGNRLPLPCACKETAAVTPAALGARGAKKTRRPRKKRAAADKNAAIVVPVDTPDDAWDEKKPQEDGKLVKVVMTRKEAAELMAKLAAERDQAAAGITEGTLANFVGGNGVTMSPCRADAWRPRLATIPENYCRY